MDPRIGKLSSGSYYAFANGYNEDPVTGTLEEVEVSLGLSSRNKKGRSEHAQRSALPNRDYSMYSVLITFEHPAWNEIDGMEYKDICASSKRDAIQKVRKLAEGDGNLGTGRGRYWLKAILQ